jgi:hypothetical protein
LSRQQYCRIETKERVQSRFIVDPPEDSGDYEALPTLAKKIFVKKSTCGNDCVDPISDAG